MGVLNGKKIVLGISGSIAAYKSANLARLLVKEGCEVRVVMTASALQFISELTLSTLTKNEVYSDLFKDGSWNNHVELGLWADAMVIAPATASTLSKMANGQSDNMLLATYLSAKCKVFFAPAMDLDMWEHPSTQSNVKRIQSYGNELINVGFGELASGLVGDGRMAEPEEIVEVLKAHIGQMLSLTGKKILITAGPTFEALDPVRFIGNHSSGKMGMAISEELAARGAEVFLVLGPTNLPVISSDIKVSKVVSAQDMYEACILKFSQCDAAILAAAVADYKPAVVSDKKIKKSGDTLDIHLTKTVDIAESLGKIKTEKQIMVGFALETTDEVENAKLKIKKKNFDFIVLNSMNDKGAGFQHDTNKISIIDRDGSCIEYKLKAKTEVAIDIVDELTKMLNNKTG